MVSYDPIYLSGLSIFWVSLIGRNYSSTSLELVLPACSGSSSFFVIVLYFSMLLLSVLLRCRPTSLFTFLIFSFHLKGCPSTFFLSLQQLCSFPFFNIPFLLLRFPNAPRMKVPDSNCYVLIAFVLLSNGEVLKPLFIPESFSKAILEACWDSGGSRYDRNQRNNGNLGISGNFALSESQFLTSKNLVVRKLETEYLCLVLRGSSTIRTSTRKDGLIRE